MKYGSINMQDIHKGLDERWDLFLKLCQSEWTYFKKYSIYIDFQSYIKLTCQEIYFVEIYDLFNHKFGTHSIGDLSNEELLSWYDAISTIDLSNKKIVTFGNDLSNDVRNINRLITIRGRLMMALVKKIGSSNLIEVLLRLTSVYCIVLLQFALLHTFLLKGVNTLETLQNLARLRGIYQIMKEKFMIRVLFICRGRTVENLINQDVMGQNWA